MNSEESLSMFGTMLGTVAGWYFGGPMGGAIGGSVVGSLFGLPAKYKAEGKRQRALSKAQTAQNKILLEKLNKDKENLYSSVQSSVLQTSGAMGAVY